MIGSYLENRIKSIKYALNGILSALKSEHNLKLEMVTGLIVLSVCVILDVSIVESCIVLCSIALVLSLELINTALERLCDLISPDSNTNIAYIKDVAAGAVLIACFISASVGILILGSAVSSLLYPLFNKITCVLR